MDRWDAGPWLLNTPAGVVDLHTGQIRPHCPDDYLIKITSVGPDASCSIPIWVKFLDRVAGGDTELRAFIGRALGYALTGETREHAMFFAYGSGANGKSVLTATAAGIMGDYHTTAPIETFVASRRSATRLTLQACAVPVSLPSPRPRKGDAGPRRRSRP